MAIRLVRNHGSRGGVLACLVIAPAVFASCETTPVSGNIRSQIRGVYNAQKRPNERMVLHRTREEILGPLKRKEDSAEITQRYLEKGTKIAIRNLFRQADLLEGDQMVLDRMSRAERIDRDLLLRVKREESPDAEAERRRSRLDGNTTNLKKVAGGQVGVTESLRLNYQRKLHKGKLDVRPKVDMKDVGVYATWRMTF